ncbi:MAG TPA: tRNA (adenosine(37)-N6)-dimethylallyltransferase MiaA [Candidatus Paceibacterota bacterium]|nr:tRNA (adenosine(37)-N6)-dimethylallyltransferase MiaA [Candidatus Paceibacterota bacterium]
MEKLPRIIALIGPTAVGKSDLAVEIALQLKKSGVDAEIVSADSRQVYTGLDLGTGKITTSEMRGIPHHLLDVANPKETYTASDFTRDGRMAIEEIVQRSAVPIVCGGSGFYIDSLIGLASIPDVPRNPKLRKSLEEITIEELYSMIQQKDPDRASTIDKHNRPRLIRAIEIIEHSGKVPAATPSPIYNVTYIGLTLPHEILKERIILRLKKRMEAGILDEIRDLHENGLSYERMEELGLEYRYGALLLQEKIILEEFNERLVNEISNYAKRQMTWFKRNKLITWLTANEIDQKTVDNLLQRLTENE